MSAFENDPTPVTTPELCQQMKHIGEARAGSLPGTDEVPTQPAADPLGTSGELVPIPSESRDLLETREHTGPGVSRDRPGYRHVVALVLAAVAGVAVATVLFLAGTVYERYSERGRPVQRMERVLGACRPERALNLAIQVKDGRVKEAHVDASSTASNRCIGERLADLEVGPKLEGFSRWRLSIEGQQVQLLLLDGPKP
jgi:hypothetical protein